MTLAEQDVQAKLIAMGAKPASTDSQIQTMAVSKLSPGVVVPGAVTGSTPSGQGIAPVQTQFQAATGVADAQNKAFLDQQKYLEATKNGTDLTGVSQPGATPSGTAPTAPVAPSGATPMPTAGQIASGAIPGEDPALQAAYDAQGKAIQATQGPIDEQAIRDQAIQKFQTQIDALDRYYATLKSQRQAAETTLGKGRLGSNSAIEARRGLIGSDFGAAQTDKINQNEADIQRGIADQVDAEHNAQVQAILGNARSNADAEIAAKNAAKTKGAQEYIDFLKGAAERKQTAAATAIQNLIAANSNPSDADLKQLATTLGMDVQTIKSQLTSAKATAAETAAKSALKPIIVNGIAYDPTPGPDGTLKALTPGETEKPLVVGGVAYQKQADGSYKAVTPTATEKPLSRVVGKILYTSTDGGLHWAPAQGVKGALPVNKSRTSNNSSTNTSIYEGISKDIAAIMGSDGKVDTAKFPQLRQHVAVTQPKLLTWFDKTYPIKQVMNPEDPTASQYFSK